MIVRAVVRVILRANDFFSTGVRRAPAECGGARNSVGHYHSDLLRPLGLLYMSFEVHRIPIYKRNTDVE